MEPRGTGARGLRIDPNVGAGRGAYATVLDEGDDKLLTELSFFTTGFHSL